ncbi:hypothetical protein BH24ACT3_BH24ACT3_08820 [soil metagenome]
MSDHWGYITAGYVIVFVTLALYALRTVARGRRLAQRLPPERRRWM